MNVPSSPLRKRSAIRRPRPERVRASSRRCVRGLGAGQVPDAGRCICGAECEGEQRASPANRRMRRLADTLVSEFVTPTGLVPTVAPSESSFDPVCHWRGPVWVSTTWLLIEGLHVDGHHSLAHRLTTGLIGVVERSCQHQTPQPPTTTSAQGPSSVPLRRPHRRPPWSHTERRDPHQGFRGRRSQPRPTSKEEQNARSMLTDP